MPVRVIRGPPIWREVLDAHRSEGPSRRPGPHHGGVACRPHVPHPPGRRRLRHRGRDRLRQPPPVRADRGPRRLPRDALRRRGEGRGGRRPTSYSPPTTEDLWPQAPPGEPCHGRGADRPLSSACPGRTGRRRDPHRGQAVQPERAVLGLLRREGFPTVGGHQAHGLGPGHARRGDRLPDAQETPTGWPSPAATPTSPRTSAGPPPTSTSPFSPANGRWRTTPSPSRPRWWR